MKTSLLNLIGFSGVLLLPWYSVSAQSDYPWLRNADELYGMEAYDEAETMYRKALVEKPKPSTTYNLGNTIYRQNRMPEAVTQYQKAIESTQDPGLKADAWFNLGNAHFQNQSYDESIRAYKESLKLRPSDEDAKKNLMLAMQQLKQQQEKQQQQQDQQQPPPEQQEQDQQPQQPPSNPDPQQAEPQHPENINEDEAREILKAVEREDQRVQEKLKKTNARKTPPVKDW